MRELFERCRYGSHGFIAWVVKCCRNWEDLGPDRDKLNPDDQILIRFCELGLKFSLLGTALSVILIPVYSTGWGGAVGFNVLCLSNLSRGGSIRFWCVIFSAYVLTWAFGYLVTKEWQNFVNLRRRHFEKAASGKLDEQRGKDKPEAATMSRTLMVQEIPKEQWKKDKIQLYFEQIFGYGSVLHCALATDGTEDLHPEMGEVAHILQMNVCSATAFVTLKSAQFCAEAQQVFLRHGEGQGPARGCRTPTRARHVHRGLASQYAQFGAGKLLEVKLQNMLCDGNVAQDKMKE